MEPFAKEIVKVSIEDEMRRSYLDYAMSVIVGRALPDVRDGLKPVHRRVLFAMHELSNDWNKPFKKSARIVGDVIGKYHPHGDSAVYDTIVRMAQDFSLRYPLVDGQGNFGSVDGDNAAAMRYTEIRMSRMAHELLADIEKETVDFQPNYDGSEHEPSVMPTRIPNLLVNGSSGIAVGMATNIPPHNLAEVVSACIALIHEPALEVDDLLQYVKAPDFPTRGFVYGMAGVMDAYRTGRGRVVMRARTHFEDLEKSGRQAVIVDELPYQVNKATLCVRIGELVREKRLEGIADLRDESDKSGMRVVIELKRGANPQVVLNQLYSETQMEDSFGVNMVALVDGRPRLLNLRDMLVAFVEFRRDVVVRRTRYELRKARERGHILEGLAVALSNVDDVIDLIRSAPNPPAAKEGLMARAWRSPLVEEMLARIAADAARPEKLGPEYGLREDGYHLSDGQAQAILELRLQRLTGLERDKIMSEYDEVMARIVDLLDILGRRERVDQVVEAELEEVRAQYGDERRSEIIASAEDRCREDLINPVDMVVTFSHHGYVKAQPLSEYRAQRRGGRGRLSASTKEEDFIERVLVAHSHDHLLCFTDRGVVYRVRVFDLPQGGRQHRGRPLNNFTGAQDGERVNAVLAVKEFDPNHYIVMATTAGTIKKTPLENFDRQRSKGLIAVDLDEGDRLIDAGITDGACDIMLFSDGGRAVRFGEDDVRSMGRTARGVRGMRLAEGQQVVSMLVVSGDEDYVLAATENGFGKRTPVGDYPRHGRGGQGVLAIAASDRNGKLVRARLVREDDEVVLVTDGGVLIRTYVGEIRATGRVAQGVTLIALDEGEHLSGMEKVVIAETGEDEEDGVTEEPGQEAPVDGGSGDEQA